MAEHISKNGQVYQVGHVLDSNNAAFDITVYFRFPTMEEYARDLHDPAAPITNVHFAGWHFGEYTPEDAEFCIREYAASQSQRQTLMARDADDPRLVEFHNNIVSKFRIHRDEATRASDRAAAQLRAEPNMHDAATAAYNLAVAETKILTCDRLQFVFNQAWLALNEPEPLGEIDPDLPCDPQDYDPVEAAFHPGRYADTTRPVPEQPCVDDLPRDPEWYDECDREDRDEDGNWDGDKTPYYKK